MDEKMIAAIVTRKWPLAQGYHAVELETKHQMELPPFEDGAIVDLVRDNGSRTVRSHPLWRIPSRNDAFVLGVRQEAGRETKQVSSGSSWNRGDEIHMGVPRDPSVVIDRSARYILFSAGVGVKAIAGVARHIASVSRCCLEIHNFARTPERAVFRTDLDELRDHAQVNHRIGLSEEQIASAAAHAVSPTHANSHVICSGPPSFMKLIERQALQWVYPSNVHKIVLGDKVFGK
ncbi:ferredoxin reductase domain-containing protein [Paraburkholderia fungorum]|uniref:oxidoreductase n=1 Tax=Paraburkholderia fungorum TaxID=134537 RepID=UPI0038B9DD65